MEVMEPLEAVEDMKAHMENTIWMRTMKRPKQPKILKDIKVNQTFSLKFLHQLTII